MKAILQGATYSKMATDLDTVNFSSIFFFQSLEKNFDGLAYT